MIHTYITWLLAFCQLLTFQTVSFAQSADPTARVIKADYVEGTASLRNYMVNPGFEDNAKGVTCTMFNCQRVTSGSSRISGKGSYSVLDLGAVNTIKFDVKSFLNTELRNGNCGVSFDYTGSEKYKVYIEQGGSKVTPDYTFEATQLDKLKTLPEIIFPCGDGSLASKVVIQANASGSNGALVVDNMYFGKPRNLGGSDPGSTWTDGGAFTIGAVTTPPTTGTIVKNNVWYKRNSDELLVRHEFEQSSGTATGSGDYLFPIPAAAGCTVDTTKMAVYTGTSNSGYHSNAGTASAGNATTAAEGLAVLYNSSSVRLLVNGASKNYVSASQLPANAAVRYSTNIRVPCVGWNAVQSIRLDQTNYDWTSYTPSNQGLGTLTNVNCKHKRQGADLLLDCTMTLGTTSGVETRWGLPSGLISASNLPTLSIAGKLAASNGLTSEDPLILKEPGVSYVTFGSQSGAANGLFKRTANGLASGSTISFFARVPIQGWIENQNAPLLVGGVSSSAQTNTRIEYVTFHGATASAVCATTPCPNSDKTPAITQIVRTGTGNYRLEFPSGTFSAPPKCTTSVFDVARATWCGRGSTVPTTTTYSLICADVSNPAVDVVADVVCVGPR